jgi:transcriptional regulator with XRE-family HTH domain
MVKVKKKRISYCKPFLKVKARMVEKEITQEEMAKHLGISPSTFNHKINATDGAEFKLTEIKAIASILEIPAEGFQEHFFPA